MRALFDTGPWVAIIDRSETRHNDCVQWFKNYTGRLYSTEAVLTEVLYLLNFSITAQTAALDFILQSVVEIVPSSIQSLSRVRVLMKKYADLPMDYADATLVCLAVDAGIGDIATLDKDFAIYRLPGKKRFRAMP